MNITLKIKIINKVFRKYQDIILIKQKIQTYEKKIKPLMILMDFNLYLNSQ